MLIQFNSISVSLIMFKFINYEMSSVQLLAGLLKATVLLFISSQFNNIVEVAKFINYGANSIQLKAALQKTIMSSCSSIQFSCVFIQ